jgi:hypothetical protein
MCNGVLRARGDCKHQGRMRRSRDARKALAEESPRDLEAPIDCPEFRRPPNSSERNSPCATTVISVLGNKFKYFWGDIAWNIMANLINIIQ